MMRFLIIAVVLETRMVPLAVPLSDGSDQGSVKEFLLELQVEAKKSKK